MNGIQCLAVVLFLVTAGAVGCDDRVEPQAAAILDRAVEASGGWGALEKIRDRVVEGRVVLPDVEVEGKTVEYTARPDRRYFLCESDLLGTVHMGCDGNLVWYQAEGAGAAIETGEAGQVGLQECAFDGHLRWRGRYRRAVCDGEEVIEGQTCHKIVLTPRVGEPEVRWYGKESGLLVRRKMTRLSVSLGDTPMELTYGDYREVDGIQIPFTTRLVMQRCGSEQERLFFTSSVRHNVDLPPSRFDLPDEVMAAALAEAPGCCGSGQTSDGQDECCPDGGGGDCGEGCSGG